MLLEIVKNKLNHEKCAFLVLTAFSFSIWDCRCDFRIPKQIIIGLIVGFIFGNVYTLDRIDMNTKKANGQKDSFGSLIGSSAVVGLIIAALACLFCNSLIGAFSSLAGSVLGSVVGCLYKSNT